MPPAFTNITSGATSGSVVSGDPHLAQERRPTRLPLAPMVSKTFVGPSSWNVDLLMMMTVEKAVPDCGRHLLQWHSAATIGFSEILYRTAPHMHPPVMEFGTSGKLFVITTSHLLSLMTSIVLAACRHVTLMRRGYLISKKGSEVEKASLSVACQDSDAARAAKGLVHYRADLEIDP
jgi:hypothetical protein